MKKRLLAATMCAVMVASTVPVAGAANTVPATPTRTKGQSVYVGNTRVYPTGYNIADNNYFKLRDLGKLAGFGVDWDETTRSVLISTERTTPALSNMVDMALTGSIAKLSPQTFKVDGEQIAIKSYLIRGNNYVKLRDIAKEVHFGVDFDLATKKVTIDPDGVYIDDENIPITPDKPSEPTQPSSPTTPNTPATGSAITKWNSTMNDFSEAMINCNWSHDKYLAVAKEYGPIITGKTNATTSDVIVALETMTGAPVDAVSMDDKPVNVFWAKELRKAIGENVADNKPTIDTGSSDNGNSSAGTGSNSTVVTDAMLRQWEQEMILMINEERAKAGAPSLTENNVLTDFAQYWAKHLATEFRHSDVDDWKDYASVYGVQLNDLNSNENITTAGNTSLLNSEMPFSRAMRNFMNSEGHRNTILQTYYTRVGVGFFVSEDGSVYCVQKFS